jgi:glycosyltransferase involved in cell wall biosynthesis
MGEVMRIGIIAPPWLPVPPRRYGGIEVMIDGLARGLKARGHEVILVSSKSSTCPVTRIGIGTGPSGHDQMGDAMIEIPYTIRAYGALEAAGVDIIHDHTPTGFLAVQTQIPVVTTNHNLFDDDRNLIFATAASRHIPVIAISENHATSAFPSTVSDVILHGIDVDHIPVGRGEGEYLLTLGRMSPVKGVRQAIEIATIAGLPLMIAARMQEPGERAYFDREIRPLLDNGHIEYLGEVSRSEKFELLGQARYLINPIQWPEPFGLVMIESMACGTPVISTPYGSVPEIITDGVTGYLNQTVRGMATLASSGREISRERCREAAENHFSIDRMAADHIAVYERTVARRFDLT